jgi:hypothetical protein
MREKGRMNEKQKQKKATSDDRHCDRLVQKDSLHAFRTFMRNYWLNSRRNRNLVWSPLCHTGLKAPFYQR